MSKNTESTSTHWTTIAQAPWMQGPLLGASVMYLITPLLKWTNHALKGEKMSFRNPLSGAVSYALSAVPGYATTFAVKAAFKKSPENISKPYDLFTSFVAGGFSGFACTPFEALAQNKQLTKSSSSKETALKMVAHHGYRSFFQGGVSFMVREGLWSMVYMTAIPMVSHYFQTQGVKKQQAELLAVLMVAGIYGLLSSPLNQLRFKKQGGLTEQTPNKSYLEHAKDIWNQEPAASSRTRMGFFFKAGTPRTITAMVAGGLMLKGAEAYKQTVDAYLR